MSLLVLENVTKSALMGSREHMVLRNVALVLESGEYAVVWGRRGSGRSTLLRVAAGVQAPDRGRVCFEGRDLQRSGGSALGEGIGYCHVAPGGGEGRSVLEQVTIGLLARRVPSARARACAERALERCGVLDRAASAPSALEPAEAVRVAIARTLALEPRLVVIDDPTHGVELIERDGILLLLRSLANEGVAVLACTGEPTGLSGADRTLALSNGELRGSLTPPLATVVPLRPAAGGQRVAG
jgi:ABC-type sugar transport system ATPase subunit